MDIEIQTEKQIDISNVTTMFPSETKSEWEKLMDAVNPPLDSQVG